MRDEATGVLVVVDLQEVHRRRCEGDWFYVNSGREFGTRSAVATTFSPVSMAARAD